MMDEIGNSWVGLTLPFDLLAGGGAGDPGAKAWVGLAIVTAAGICGIWLYIRAGRATAVRVDIQAMVREVQREVRNLHAAVADDSLLDQAIMRDLLYAGQMRAIPQLARGEIADQQSPQNADKIPAPAAENNSRKSPQKIPRKARKNAVDVPSCARTFIERHVVRRAGGKLTPTDFHSAYAAWCLEQGIAPVGINKFGRAVTEIGGYAKDGRHYLNVALRGSMLKVVRADVMSS